MRLRPERVETWIFDLDNTLYHPATGVLARIDARMTAFIMVELGVDREEAGRLRTLYWERHGITLEGLVRHHGICADAFLADTHAIALDGLGPDPDLAAAIAALPGRRIVHTNGSRAHARRVLEARGLAPLFDAVFALEDKGLVPKPRPEAYATVLDRAGAEAARSAMIEDTAANLVEPHRLGMGTVWLTHGPAPERHDHVDAVAEDLLPFLRGLVAR